MNSDRNRLGFTARLSESSIADGHTITSTHWQRCAVRCMRVIVALPMAMSVTAGARGVTASPQSPADPESAVIISYF